jgi:hypothetical protein
MRTLFLRGSHIKLAVTLPADMTTVFDKTFQYHHNNASSGGFKVLEIIQFAVADLAARICVCLCECV